MSVLLLAGSPALANPATPDAQRLEPALDARTFSVVDAPYGQAPWTGGAGMTVNHAHAPLVLDYTDGRDSLVLVESLSTAELTGWLHVPHARIGVGVPLHVGSDGFQADSPRTLGDLRLDAMWVLRDGGGFRLGLAGISRLPTGDADSWLGAPGPVVGAQARAGWTLGPVELGAEAGVRSTGGVEVGEDAARVQLDSALGTAIEVTEAIALVAEASGTVSPGIASPVALEPLATLRVRNKAGLTVRAGAGAGVLGGMGEPDWRLLAGIQWIPEAAQPQLRLSSQYDSDRDGIPNDRDRCVEQAEDFNGVADDDGCPEAGLIPPTIEVVDQTGRLVADASLEVMSGPTSGSWRLTRGSWNRSIPAGAYRVKVAALGHRPLELNLEVPETTTWSTRITMESVVSPGRVRVVVTDANGRATPARIELVSPDEKSEHRAEDGVWAGALPAGTYTLNVAAKGLVPVERVISVEPERTLEVTLALSAGQVRIEGDQIVFTDRIFFEQGSDIIQRRSFPLLDEIAATMVRHPELRVVAVHGHTDDQGSESYNLDLSLRRAMAVVQFLEASGVEQSRLQAFGMGEATPLLAGPSAEARAANRRVEFRIVQRTPSKASN